MFGKSNFPLRAKKHVHLEFSFDLFLYINLRPRVGFSKFQQSKYKWKKKSVNQAKNQRNVVNNAICLTDITQNKYNVLELKLIVYRFRYFR